MPRILFLCLRARATHRYNVTGILNETGPGIFAFGYRSRRGVCWVDQRASFVLGLSTQSLVGLGCDLHSGRGAGMS